MTAPEGWMFADSDALPWQAMGPGVEMKTLASAGGRLIAMFKFDAGYEGGFLAHYLLPLIYPAGFTREIGVALGLGVILVNVVVYALVVRRARQRTGRDSALPGRIRTSVHPEDSPCNRKS